MDLIKINENKLKIMLTPGDMQSYDIRAEELSLSGQKTRRAFRTILEEARDRIGFDAEGDRIYIQLYPSREGGCELFVTKLGMVCALGEGKEDKDAPYLSAGTAAERTLPRPRREEGDARSRWVAFAFERLEHLLHVCRRLQKDAFGGESAAYRGEEGRYFLLLSEHPGGRRPGGHPPAVLDRGALSLISEYGIQQNAEAVRLYIKEHASPICECGAVERLAGL